PPSVFAHDVSPVFDAILARGLSRDRTARFSTAHEMASALEACVDAVRPSEIGAWVSRVAGPALVERARIVARMEEISQSEIETPLPSRPSMTTSPTAALTRISLSPRIPLPTLPTVTIGGDTDPIQTTKPSAGVVPPPSEAGRSDTFTEDTRLGTLHL